MTTISRITADDRPAWDALWQAYITFYESEVPADVSNTTFERILAHKDLHGALARDAAGTPIGLVHWLTHPATWTTGSYCYLEDLFVDPGSRGSGAGRALIDHVKGWAKLYGASKVYWLTADDNATARALYDKVAVSTGFVHYEIEL
ncbi:GNAT family N-acetyltransferase [Microbacterium sulfonylureivorans]|uniref:GNAT family N-acetyltransferase n=1 Tax=Microbacterium sulfonylureivorans TaxID=2486854 RepID=UPI000FDC68CF|nr:GNAT family N-acetyltransferase [Microbacterium sulfonylureivorans]